MKKAWIREDLLYLLVILLLIWMMAARTPLDTDTWWHLRAGEETWVNREVYRVDTFSSTRQGTDWTNHSWLAQILMYGILRIGGMPGLSIWVAGCAVLSMGLVYGRMEGHPLLRGTVILLAGTVSSVVWTPRPQVMSLVMLALVCWLVDRYWKEGKIRYLLLLLPAFTLWANLHGGYILGLIYLGAVLAGELFDWLISGWPAESNRSQKAGLLLLATIGSILAVLINPFGIEIWWIPFNTVGVETLQNLINEWASPDFHQAFQMPFLVMLLLLMAAWALSKQRAFGRDLIPVLVFSAAALISRRNFGPFGIIAAPVLAAKTAELLSSWVQRSRTRWPMFNRSIRLAETNNADFKPWLRNLINLTLITLLVLAGVIKTIEVNQPPFMERQEAILFPVEAAEFLNEYQGTVSLFNDYNWGGYLIYRVRDIPVFVDGRTDLFGDEILADYVQAIEADPGWPAVLSRYRIDTLLLPRDSQLAAAAEMEGWEIIYQDHLAVILQE